jgi:hypothetical protein
MSQTKEEALSIFASWIGPVGLADTEGNGNKIVKYILAHGGVFSHANLTTAVNNIASSLEWETPAAPAPKPRKEYPNIGEGSVKEHRSHKVVSGEEKVERDGNIATLETIRGVIRKIQADRAAEESIPTIYKNGRIDWAATQAARAKAAPAK